MEKLKQTTRYTEEHDIPIDIPPTIEEIAEKVNEIIDWINNHPHA
jgi:hypothetical protein